MGLIKKSLLSALIGVSAMGAAYAAPQNMRGTASVNVTSETAAAAKTRAFDQARRQVILDTLGQYSDRVALSDLVRASTAADLTNLIASSSIEGEQLSDTTYVANITMEVDGPAAQRWLRANNIQNWLPDAASGNRFVVVVTMGDRMANWIELQGIARTENIDLDTRAIVGNQATLEVPVASRGALINALRSVGWRYSDDGGLLRIWK